MGPNPTLDPELPECGFQPLRDRVGVGVDDPLLVRVVGHEPDDEPSDLREGLLAVVVGHLTLGGVEQGAVLDREGV